MADASVQIVSRPEPVGAQSARPRRDEAIIAVGDAALHDAADCLSQRGITVHPRVIRTVDELLKVIAAALSRHTVVHVHVEALDDLVDGHIQKALTLAPAGSRVTWATIRRAEYAWSDFSPEERINASIRNVVGRDPGARLLDWYSATNRHPDWFIDGVGLTASGCAEYAAKVVKLSGLARGA
jgi:hypothetical protein